MHLEEIVNSLTTQKHTKVFGGNELFGAYHNFKITNKDAAEEFAEIFFQRGPAKEN